MMQIEDVYTIGEYFEKLELICGNTQCHVHFIKSVKKISIFANAF